MTKEEITAWALKTGWRMLGGMPSLTRPGKPQDPIVRLVLKATVVHVEAKKPAGKWEKMAGAAYGDVHPDPDTGVPRGIGLVSTTGFAKLMQDNRDAQVFG